MSRYQDAKMADVLAAIREWQAARRECMANDFESWRRLADAEAALARIDAREPKA